MTYQRAVLAFAGMMVLLSLALTHFFSPLFMWFSVFIGLNLVQYSITGFCPAAWFFKKIGLKSECNK
ncbi:DUF2892 domain-containing protein [Psychrobium sp. 1_MG-2023]|uniref:YgaP family membrane protein n=1 Tax=Psychrobium sp. 1_MG-2023 TaxID=3062624 RepID=UPI000C31BE03|nr:DUF2892 domain-containing protein [Psychrobium sp. 1_MG-2023]MDP2560199.1 DUF2892 domain-containing protein [Psychrobium sp. 1_MG-2023]PKF57010.1 DUF2892 domain-containing protein [Alteromonadales bacterium alter-6D02]